MGREISRQMIVCGACLGLGGFGGCEQCGGTGWMYQVLTLEREAPGEGEEDMGPWEQCAPLDIHPGADVFRNRKYQVIRHHYAEGPLGPMTYLSIKRLDRQPARDWRELQWIKNELVGEEWEGVELFPAESRLVDNANQYHLWVFPSRLPFGFDERLVTTPEGAAVSGATQRPFPPGRQPEDACGPEEALDQLRASGYAHLIRPDLAEPKPENRHSRRQRARRKVRD